MIALRCSLAMLPSISSSVIRLLLLLPLPITHISSQWRWGCFFYSSAVSIKMNMLLYSPGILLCLLLSTGIYETFICLTICAVWQLVLGYPFLSTYPIEYLKNSFDIGRVFMFKWTVNFKFLPEEIFVSKPLSVGLLLLTVISKLSDTHEWILTYFNSFDYLCNQMDSRGKSS